VLIEWRFFVRKFVDIEPGLLELFGNVLRVRLLRHRVYCWLLGLFFD